MLRGIFSKVYINNSKIEIVNTDDIPTGKKFKARFITPGVAGYPRKFGNVLITKESLDKFVKTLETRPIIIKHQIVTNENIKQIEVGRINNVWFNAADGWYWCDGVLTDDKAIDLINQGWSVSCSYNITLADDKGGFENNVKYDIEILDGVFTHLALVDNPRYERAMVVMNDKTEFVVDNFNPNHNEKGQFCSANDVNKVSLSLDDYRNPKQNYQLPFIPQNNLDLLNKNAKPVLLKMNIIEKNKLHHPEIDETENNDILTNGLYKTDLILKTKDTDEYYNFIHLDNEKNQQVLIELSETKDNYEIVGWHYLNEENLKQKISKAKQKITINNEVGQVLITERGKSQGAAVLSALDIDCSNIITNSETDFKGEDVEVDTSQFIEALKQACVEVLNKD